MGAAQADAPRSSADRGAGRRSIPIWKRVLLVLAALSAGAGLTLYGLGAAGPAPPTGQKSAAPRDDGSSALAPGFLPKSDSDSSPDDADADNDESADAPGLLAPLLTKLGFGFFIGFCVGYALRVAFKISLLVIGVIMLAVLGLSYSGVLDVDWAAMRGHYDTVVAWLQAQFTNLRGFISGQVPSSASAAFGLFVGFRK